MYKFLEVNSQRKPQSEMRLWERGLLGLGFVLTCLLFGTGCTTTPQNDPLPTSTPTPAASAWGKIEMLTQAERLDAPAMLVDEDKSPVFAWRGADANGARLFAQTRGVTRPLALAAFYPFDEMLFPAAQGGYHLLWLDRTADDEALYVQSARFSRDAIAELGANNVSTLPARRYDAVALPDERVQVVWSSVPQQAPNLYAAMIDSNGRIAFAEEIELEGDYPSLAYHDEAVHLYWLEEAGQQAYTARLVDNQLVLKRPLAYLEGISLGDIVEHFHISMTETHLYIFWQVRRDNGERDIWYTSGALDDFSPLPDPQVLRVIINMPDEVDLPRFNTYDDMALAYGVQARFLATLPSTSEPLPLVVQAGSELGLAYFQSGTLVGYQRIVQTELILGQPTFTTDAAGNFYLAWSDSRHPTTANLLWTRQ